MYNHIDAGQVSDFELYDVIAKLAMIYEKILEYSKLQFSTKHDRLHTINSQNLRIIAK